MKAEEPVGVEGRQQIGPGAKANTVPKRGGEGRSLGKWVPSPKAIKHSHFCREGIKFLRGLESHPRISTCKRMHLLEVLWRTNGF